jgi:hypothetical protein
MMALNSLKSWRPFLEVMTLYKHRPIHVTFYLYDLFFGEEFEDTKGVSSIRKSKKNRKYNGQKKKDKRTKHYAKSKDRTAPPH